MNRLVARHNAWPDRVRSSHRPSGRPLADELELLARHIERLGVGGRADVLRALARELSLGSVRSTWRRISDEIDTAFEMLPSQPLLRVTRAASPWERAHDACHELWGRDVRWTDERGA